VDIVVYTPVEKEAAWKDIFQAACSGRAMTRLECK